MPLLPSVDATIRHALKRLLESPAALLTQEELAKRIGRSPGWLNKYINGSGHATIDDLVRIAYQVFTTGGASADPAEQRWRRLWKRIPVARQHEVVETVAALTRNIRRSERAVKSSGRPGHKNAGRGNTKPGTR